MARRIVPVDRDNVKDLPRPCRDCFFWENQEKLSGPQDFPEAFQRKTEWFARTSGEWGNCGKLIYDDNAVLGYIQFAPFSYLPQSHHFPAAPVSKKAALISCLYVVPEMRGRGLGKVVLQSALKDLLKKRMRIVEAFASREEPYQLVPIDFYLKNGFYVLRDDKRFPLVRLDLRASVTWHVNVQAMLDSLKIPVRVPATSS